MPLEPGQMLSHYRLAEKIGEGGMGVVWRARDTRLDRDVAIKLLPESLTDNAERLARFEREAKVLASLNHPNIAAIHELGHDGGNHFLALELVEGEDLAARMTRGVIPVPEALALAAQIAHALEAAHESQVVHRDLKPQNVKVTPDGRVKVLDFGLAKVWVPDGSETSLSFSPTITAHMTQAGVILGTAAYMSPEQARGQEVDKRSDIWAFGVLLYEMLSGGRLFAGDTATDILGAIVHRRPDWARLPDETPPALTRLLKRCLTQELPDRLRDIGEARYALEHLDQEPSPSATPEATPPRTAWPWKAAAGLLLLLAAALAVMLLVPRGRAPGQVLQATIQPPAGHRLLSTAERGGPVRVSPDGRMLAFVALDDRSVAQVWVRPLDAAEARPVPGTEGASRPFWSPDSRSLAFFADGKLRRVGLEGGGVLAVADAADGRGGDWSPEGVILFTPTPGSRIWRVPAGGGEAVEAAIPGTVNQGEESAREPRFLPDGHHYLALWQNSNSPEWKVYVDAVDGSEHRFVTKTNGGAVFSEGYLLSLRGTTLVTQRFDPDTFVLSGDPMPVTENVTVDSNYGIGVFSTGPGGLLAYQSGSGTRTQITWVGMDGKVLGTVGSPDSYDQIGMSRDGTRALVTLTQSDGIRDLWMVDLQQKTRTRFTFSTSENPALHGEPLWSPDGKWVAYISNRGGHYQIYRKPADGLGDEELLVEAPEDLWCYDWSRDGRYIVYGHEQPQHRNNEDLFAVPVSGDGETIRITNTPFHEWPASFSPDSRWLAYDSNESGQREIYVVPFPGLGGRWQVSTDGGRYPNWSPDGSRLYYWKAGELMAVPLQFAGNTLKTGPAEKVLELPWGSGLDTWDIRPDGKAILILGQDASAGPAAISLFINWQDALERR